MKINTSLILDKFTDTLRVDKRGFRIFIQSTSPKIVNLQFWYDQNVTCMIVLLLTLVTRLCVLLFKMFINSYDTFLLGKYYSGGIYDIL